MSEVVVSLDCSTELHKSLGLLLDSWCKAHEDGILADSSCPSLFKFSAAKIEASVAAPAGHLSFKQMMVCGTQ